MQVSPLVETTTSCFGLSERQQQQQQQQSLLLSLLHSPVTALGTTWKQQMMTKSHPTTTTCRPPPPQNVPPVSVKDGGGLGPVNKGPIEAGQITEGPHVTAVPAMTATSPNLLLLSPRREEHDDASAAADDDDGGERPETPRSSRRSHRHRRDQQHQHLPLNPPPPKGSDGGHEHERSPQGVEEELMAALARMDAKMDAQKQRQQQQQQQRQQARSASSPSKRGPSSPPPPPPSPAAMTTTPRGSPRRSGKRRPDGGGADAKAAGASTRGSPRKNSIGIGIGIDGGDDVATRPLSAEAAAALLHRESLMHSSSPLCPSRKPAILTMTTPPTSGRHSHRPVSSSRHVSSSSATRRSRQGGGQQQQSILTTMAVGPRELEAILGLGIVPPMTGNEDNDQDGEGDEDGKVEVDGGPASLDGGAAAFSGAETTTTTAAARTADETTSSSSSSSSGASGSSGAANDTRDGNVPPVPVKRDKHRVKRGRGGAAAVASSRTETRHSISSSKGGRTGKNGPPPGDAGDAVGDCPNGSSHTSLRDLKTLFPRECPGLPVPDDGELKRRYKSPRTDRHPYSTLSSPMSPSPTTVWKRNNKPSTRRHVANAGAVADSPRPVAKSSSAKQTSTLPDTAAAGLPGTPTVTTNEGICTAASESYSDRVVMASNSSHGPSGGCSSSISGGKYTESSSNSAASRSFSKLDVEHDKWGSQRRPYAQQPPRCASTPGGAMARNSLRLPDSIHEEVGSAVESSSSDEKDGNVGKKGAEKERHDDDEYENVPDFAGDDDPTQIETEPPVSPTRALPMPVWSSSTQHLHMQSGDADPSGNMKGGPSVVDTTYVSPRRAAMKKIRTLFKIPLPNLNGLNSSARSLLLDDVANDESFSDAPEGPSSTAGNVDASDGIELNIPPPKQPGDKAGRRVEAASEASPAKQKKKKSGPFGAKSRLSNALRRLNLGLSEDVKENHGWGALDEGQRSLTELQAAQLHACSDGLRHSIPSSPQADVGTEPHPKRDEGEGTTEGAVVWAELDVSNRSGVAVKMNVPRRLRNRSPKPSKRQQSPLGRDRGNRPKSVPRSNRQRTSSPPKKSTRSDEASADRRPRTGGNGTETREKQPSDSALPRPRSRIASRSLSPRKTPRQMKEAVKTAAPRRSTSQDRAGQRSEVRSKFCRSKASIQRSNDRPSNTTPISRKYLLSTPNGKPKSAQSMGHPGNGDRSSSHDTVKTPSRQYNRNHHHDHGNLNHNDEEDDSLGVYGSQSLQELLKKVKSKVEEKKSSSVVLAASAVSVASMTRDDLRNSMHW